MVIDKESLKENIELACGLLESKMAKRVDLDLKVEMGEFEDPTIEKRLPLTAYWAGTVMRFDIKTSGV